MENKDKEITIKSSMIKRKLKEGIDEYCEYGTSKQFSNELLTVIIEPLIDYFKENKIIIK